MTSRWRVAVSIVGLAVFIALPPRPVEGHEWLRRAIRRGAHAVLAAGVAAACSSGPFRDHAPNHADAPQDARCHTLIPAELGPRGWVVRVNAERHAGGALRRFELSAKPSLADNQPRLSVPQQLWKALQQEQMIPTDLECDVRVIIPTRDLREPLTYERVRAWPTPAKDPVISLPRSGSSSITLRYVDNDDDGSKKGMYYDYARECEPPEPVSPGRRVPGDPPPRTPSSPPGFEVEPMKAWAQALLGERGMSAK